MQFVIMGIKQMFVLNGLAFASSMFVIVRAFSKKKLSILLK